MLQRSSSVYLKELQKGRKMAMLILMEMHEGVSN